MTRVGAPPRPPARSLGAARHPARGPAWARPVRLATLALGLAGARASAAQATPPPSSAGADTVALLAAARAFMDGYGRDLRAGRGAALGARYDTAGSYVVGMGRKTLRAYAEITAGYASAPPQRITFRDLAYEALGPGAVLVTGLFDLAADDTTRAPLTFAYVGVLRRGPGGLRLRLEHESPDPRALGWRPPAQTAAPRGATPTPEPESAVSDSGTPTVLATAVRDARARWNAAVTARDTTALGRLADDSIVQASPYFVRTGRARYVAGLARQFAQRPQFAMVDTPERVEAQAFPTGVVATEYGRWRETWREQGEPTEMRGTYYAVWTERAGAWVLLRETFAPLACVGLRYCSR